MNQLIQSVQAIDEGLSIPPAASAPLAIPALLGQPATSLLERMFRDPRVLKPEDRRSLVTELRSAVELAPHLPEVRVIYGMALCVDLQVQEAMEQLREATRQAPDCFIARLKFGELLMRLRICGQAAEETQKAAELAANAAQSELARKQATAIRTMLREGIERGGYQSLLARLTPRGRKAKRSKSSTPLLPGSR